jgi:hypothetical protein
MPESDNNEHAYNLTLANTRARQNDYFIFSCWFKWILVADWKQSLKRF